MSELHQKQFQFSKMFGELLIWIYQQGYTCQLGDGWRSTDKLKVPGLSGGEITYQELLVFNGRSKVKYGKHNDRLAIDLIIYKDERRLTDEEHRPIGEKWETMGGMWGGRFGVKKEEYDKKVGWDAGHFESA